MQRLPSLEGEGDNAYASGVNAQTAQPMHWMWRDGAEFQKIGSVRGYVASGARVHKERAFHNGNWGGFSSESLERSNVCLMGIFPPIERGACDIVIGEEGRVLVQIGHVGGTFGGHSGCRSGSSDGGSGGTCLRMEAQFLVTRSKRRENGVCGVQARYSIVFVFVDTCQYERTQGLIGFGPDVMCGGVCDRVGTRKLPIEVFHNTLVST
jgi:hypothetical protein